MLIPIDKTEHLIYQEGGATKHALYIDNGYLVITTNDQDKEEITEILQSDIAPPIQKEQLLTLCEAQPDTYTINTDQKEAYLTFLNVKHRDRVEFTGRPMPTESFESMKEWYAEHIRLLREKEDALFTPSPEVLEAITREKLIEEIKPRIKEASPAFSDSDFPRREERENMTLRSFVAWLEKPVDDLLAPRQSHQTEHSEPKTLEDIFVDPALAQPCINVLLTVVPPILNAQQQYIGKHKGVYCIWIRRMARKGLIHHYPDHIYARLINEKFPPFSISAALFRKILIRAEEIYAQQIDHLLSQLSQSGRKGK